MDPVSVIALIASIESLADGAFKLVSFINTIKEGGRQRLRLFTELNSLWMVLKLVEGQFHLEDEKPSEPWLRTIEVLDQDGGVFDQMQSCFENLTTRLQPRTGHRKTMQTLRWPFDKSDVEAQIALLERLKGSVNLAFTSTNAEITRQIQNDTKALKLSAANDEAQAIINWISSLNFMKEQVSRTVTASGL